MTTIENTKAQRTSMNHINLKIITWQMPLSIAALFFLLGADRCIGASWEGTDDFSSGISTNNWLIRPHVDGQMDVVGANGHASFIVPISTTAEQNAGIVWKGLPAATNDWTADVLGHNSAGWSANDRSEFKFMVLDLYQGIPVAGGEFAIRMSLGATNANNPYPRDFRTVYYPGNISTVRQIAQTTTTNFSLRFVHKGGLAGNIEAWYDSTGNGTTWTLLDTISVSSFSPSMTSTHSFALEIMADCYYGPIAEGDLWADNFRITSNVLPPPQLVVAASQRSSGFQFLNLTWTNNGSLCVLESAGAVTGSWSPVFSPWNTNAGWVSTTVSNSSATQFYRLRAN